MNALLVYGHPALATVTLLLAWFVFRAGFHQRIQRLRRVTAPPGSLARHLKLGPLSVALFVASAIGGLGSAVFLRDMKPLATFHGILGIVSTLVFVGLWLLGRQLTSGKKHLANTHGVLGLLSLFAAGLTGVLGISLLP
ncbi:MAG: hypothetical protein GQE15_10610 [Archangiaceae bacterium]|nr:hypothetical protein [Archangiaceae bacterium]